MIEVVIAMAIVAAVSLAMISAVSQSSIFSRSIDTTYTSSYIAQRRIDLLKRLEFDQVTFAVETNVMVGIDGNIDPGGGYARTTEVYPDYDGNQNLARVKVSVRRLRIQSGGGRADESQAGSFTGSPVVMETLFSNVE